MSKIYWKLYSMGISWRDSKIMVGCPWSLYPSSWLALTVSFVCRVPWVLEVIAVVGFLPASSWWDLVLAFVFGFRHFVFRWSVFPGGVCAPDRGTTWVHHHPLMYIN